MKGKWKKGREKQQQDIKTELEEEDYGIMDVLSARISHKGKIDF